MKGQFEIEIENGVSGDLLDVPRDKLAEGLINILDPNPSCADTWKIIAKDFYTDRKFIVILRRIKPK